MKKAYTSLPQPPNHPMPRICAPSFAKASAGKCVGKKHARLLLLSLLAFITPALLFSQGDCPDPAIHGNYAEGEEGENFQVKVYMNFIEYSDYEWINQQEADIRAKRALDYLNKVFNEKGIFFITPGNSFCGENIANLLTDVNPAYSINHIREFVTNGIHNDGIDIYFLDDSFTYEAFAYGVPSNYTGLAGEYDDGATTYWAGDTPMLIHEMGHCLGLMHPFHNCIQAAPSGFCPNGELDCYCTGDHICDTPPVAPPTGGIPCDSLLGTNFMSWPEGNALCRDEFTEEQSQRMRAYLRQASLLGSLQLSPTVFPASSISSPSGDIVVASGELIVDSPLEMLPGASIIVEEGATLRVKSTITGACGKLWKGILVKGGDGPQSPSGQGQVVVQGVNAVIENAECAIRQEETAGGGIIKVWGATLKDNLKGIVFSPYGRRSASQALYAHFTTTDGYLGEGAPVYISMFRSFGVDIRYSKFTDERSICPGIGKLAIGIEALNAGPQVGANTFTNLNTGIHIMELQEDFPAINCYNNYFIHCARGAHTSSGNNFMIRNNYFEVQAPLESCAPLEVFGAYLSGQASGFIFTGNIFAYEGEGDPAYITTGTLCSGLNGGMANTIERNTYSRLSYGNRASGENADDDDGLLYLCNVNETFLPLPDPNLVPAAIRVDPNGSIRKIQGVLDEFNDPLFPTGNEFVDLGGRAVENLGPQINYYYLNDSNHNPNEQIDPIGISGSGGNFGIQLSIANPNCAGPEPCAPPCDEEELEASKNNFHQNKENWLDEKAAYPLITDEEERQEALKEIAGLRHHLNKDAKNILTHYRQDTLTHELDSVLHWLALVETYPADYRLARHHFFTGKFYSFDNLWPALPARYELDEAGLAEYDSLSQFFAALRPYLEGGSVINQLPEDAINSLLYWADYCNEAGALARNVLRVNGLRQETECGQPLPAQRPGAPTAPAATTPDTPAQGIRVYPNPARGELFLSLPESAGQGQAVFYNLQGKAVHYLPLSGEFNRLPLPPGLFKPGIYLLKAYQGNASYLLKVAIH